MRADRQRQQERRGVVGSDGATERALPLPVGDDDREPLDRQRDDLQIT